MADPEWFILARQAEQSYGQKRLDHAIDLALKALAINPKCALAEQVLGLVHLQQHRPREARACFERALEVKPDLVPSHNSLGRCYATLGDVERAEAHFARAIFLQPDHAFAHFNRAGTLLKRGQYKQGWLEYEWRWPCGIVARPQIPRPRWDGSSLAGKSILIHTEQGMGDVLQFMRFMPLVKQQCARLVFACQTAMQELLKPTPCVDRWFPIDSPGTVDFDLYCPLLSLPGLLGIDENSIAQPVPYVFADPQRVERWREPLKSLPGFKVGLCWQGSPTFEGDRFRSIPLKHFAPLAQAPGVTLVSLQKGAGLEQIEANQEALRLNVFGDLDQDAAFVDRAAMMEHLDLIITSDTSVAHLAGAMGKAVWIVISTSADWRWLMEREDSPWYPSARLFRQKALDDWPEVFQRVARALADLAMASTNSA